MRVFQVKKQLIWSDQFKKKRDQFKKKGSILAISAPTWKGFSLVAVELI